MAATTTAISASDAVISLDNAGGTLTDISGSSNSLTLTLNKALGDFNVFGLDWGKSQEGKRRATVSMQIVYTTTASEAIDLLNAWYFSGSGVRTLRVDVPDSNTGSDRYEMEVLLESLEWTADSSADGPSMVSVSLRADGEVTLTTIS